MNLYLQFNSVRVCLISIFQEQIEYFVYRGQNKYHKQIRGLREEKMNNELAYARVAQYPIESLYPSIGDKILNLFPKAELMGGGVGRKW